MVNIIMCDDNDKDRNNVIKIVDDFMSKNSIEYHTYVYKDYDKKFMEIIERKIPFKIYLLDIETPSKSGIDVAREIRRKDTDSVIIFFTAHEELGNIVLKNDLMFLSFINKFDNLNDRLSQSLKKALSILKQKQVIKFSDRNTIYTINIDDILYLTKESFERKTIIKTDYAEFKVNNSLSEIINMLDNRFIQTHRSCFINNDRKVKIDKTNKMIYFDNGEYTDLVSDKYKVNL